MPGSLYRRPRLASHNPMIVLHTADLKLMSEKQAVVLFIDDTISRLKKRIQNSKHSHFRSGRLQTIPSR